MFRRILGVTLSLVLLLPGAVEAQEAAAVSSARETAKSGIEDYLAGRYEAAIDKLARAFAVVPVPTLALFNARAHAKANRLVEASEHYLTCMRLPSGEGHMEAQEQARADAKIERAELLKRIPRLRVVVLGAPLEQVTIAANGYVMLPALLTTGWLVNPGPVHLVGKYGDQLVELRDQLLEGEDRTLTVRFEPRARATRDSLHDGRLRNAPTNAVQSGRSQSHEVDAYRAAFWIGSGVTALGFAFGTVTGVMAVKQRQGLDGSGHCEQVRCDASQSEQVDRLNLLRHLSTVGFSGAAAGGVTSALVYFGALKRSSKSGIALLPWVDVASVGLSGRFQ